MDYPFDPSRVPVIMAILSVFETGKAEGDYSAVAILKDGAGVSYGKHQGTDKGGSLDEIVRRYSERDGVLSRDLGLYLPRLERNETTGHYPPRLPEWLTDLVELLRRAGEDPIMRAVQDEVFDERYWLPAVKQAEEMGLVTALSYCVVYDTCIQSGPSGVWTIRKRFNEYPPSHYAEGGRDPNPDKYATAEAEWLAAYLATRHAWLSRHPNKTVQDSAVRVAALQAILEAGNVDLETPIKIGKPYKVDIT